MIEQSSVLPGDILLGYSRDIAGSEEGAITGYCHSAFYVAENEVIESCSSGVRVTNIDNLLEEYNYLAVMREELRSDTQIAKISAFLQQQIGRKFNRLGLKKYEVRKKKSLENSSKKVNSYFSADNFTPVKTDREVYFCSELIVAGFIDAGIIGESASMLFEPETLSPEDMARDKLFGFFVGYLLPYPDAQIAEDDIFLVEI